MNVSSDNIYFAWQLKSDVDNLDPNDYIDIQIKPDDINSNFTDIFNPQIVDCIDILPEAIKNQFKDDTKKTTILNYKCMKPEGNVFNIN